MILRRSSTVFDLSSRARGFTCQYCRALHNVSPEARRVPPPTPFVPDVQTFLTLIGRKTSQHAAKIPSWEALFTLSGQSLRDAGVEPARDRRYILWWRDRFRNGFYGIGGDLNKVQEGIAELRVAEMPTTEERFRAATLTKSAEARKVVINTATTPTITASPLEVDGEAQADASQDVVPPPRRRPTILPEEVRHIEGVRLVRGDTIAGTGVQPVKGEPGVARLQVREGLWEVRRGHKVNGGERRKAEVRYKRAAAEKKNAR